MKIYTALLSTAFMASIGISSYADAPTIKAALSPCQIGALTILKNDMKKAGGQNGQFIAQNAANDFINRMTACGKQACRKTAADNADAAAKAFKKCIDGVKDDAHTGPAQPSLDRMMCLKPLNEAMLKPSHQCIYSRCYNTEE